jgi:hypothetical protein
MISVSIPVFIVIGALILIGTIVRTVVERSGERNRREELRSNWEEE